ncbi:MAG: hypothetical protein WCS27_04795 [Victivallaceae bacterium]
MKKIIFAVVAMSVLLSLSAFDDCAGLTAQAVKLEKQGSYRKALTLYEKAAKKARGSNNICDTSTGEGRCHTALKEYAAAEKCFRRLLDMNDMARPEHYFKIYLGLAKLYEAKGDTKKLSKYLDKTVEYAGSERRVLLEKAHECYADKNYALTEQLMLKAVRIPGRLNSTEMVNSWKMLARAAFYGGKKEQAYKYLDEYESLENAAGYVHDEAERVRCSFLLEEKKYQQCVDTSLKLAASTMIPMFKAEAYNRAAMVLFKFLNDPAKAKEYIDKAESLKAPWGYDAGLKKNIERALLKNQAKTNMDAIRKAMDAKDYAKAEKMLLEKVAGPGKAQNKMDMWIMLAKAAFYGGKKEQAYKYIAKFKTLKDTNAYMRDTAERFRCRLLLDEKKYEECVKANLKLAASTAVAPYKAEAYNYAAMVLFKFLNDPAKAKEYIDKAEAVKAPWGYDASLKKNIEKALEK